VIRVAFPDGSHEDRPSNSPAYPDWMRPSDALYFGWHEGRFVAGPLTLANLRGSRAWAWRVTGQDSETKALNGEWQRCKVETTDEQIARLETELDEARDVARRLAALDHDEAPSLYDASLVASWGGPRR